jgi:hypothetical protein
MSKRKYVAPEFATGRNPHRVAAVQARRRSNAAGAHNPIPRQFRTRSAAKRAAIEEG